MTGTTGGGTNGAGGIGDGGEGGEGGMGSDCDTGASPSDEPCLVSDDLSVFVSPDGDDDDDGTMDEPVATFARALELADSDGKIVVACSGEYDEQVVIDGEVRIYGSFDCDDDWAYAPDAPSVVAPSTRGYALRIDGVDGEVVVEDVELVALDGEDAGESSIAGFVSESSDVTLRRVVLEAGSGVDGEDATNPGFAPFPDVTDLQGVDGTVTTGGVKAACECPDGATSTAGSGGDPGNEGDDGAPAHGGGAGGNPALDCGAGGAGLSGAPGPSPSDATGASILGTLDETGFTPASGSDGAHGFPGQGGGGGAGKTAGGGGSGGCGGCGGMGGPAGQGSGASIALLVFESTVTIEASELVAGHAGNGGSAAAGEAGQQQFGGGGDGFGVGDGGCDGGNGGNWRRRRFRRWRGGWAQCYGAQSAAVAMELPDELAPGDALVVARARGGKLCGAASRAIRRRGDAQAMKAVSIGVMGRA